MARPTKFSPEVGGRIVDIVRAGNFLTVAAASSRIDRDTVYNWLERARGPKATPELRRWAEDMYAARADAERDAVEAIYRDMRGGELVEEIEIDDDGGRTIRKFTPPNGTLALKYLTKAFPDRWSDRKPRDPDVDAGDDGGGLADTASVDALAQRIHGELRRSLLPTAAVDDDEDEIYEGDVCEGEIVP